MSGAGRAQTGTVSVTASNMALTPGGDNHTVFKNRDEKHAVRLAS
jgi:hypothetical protein